MNAPRLSTGSVFFCNVRTQCLPEQGMPGRGLLSLLREQIAQSILHATAFLFFIHALIGALQQFVRLTTVVGIHGNAHAVETGQTQIVQLQRRLQGRVDVRQALPESGMGADDKEFVAAQTEHDVRPAQAGQNPLHKAEKKGVADLMPVGIIRAFQL